MLADLRAGYEEVPRKVSEIRDTDSQDGSAGGPVKFATSGVLERPFRDCPKRDPSDAPSVNLTAFGRTKWT